MPSTLELLLQQLQTQQETAQTANLKRYNEALAIYDEIINRYKPGGTYGQAALGQLEKQKVRDVGKETQQLISSGLYGTTTMGATGRRWEEAVGAPARLTLEDLQMQRLSEAQASKAAFVERREDVGPSSELIAQLAGQVGQGGYGMPQTTTTEVGRTYGASSFPDMFRIAGEGGVGGVGSKTPTTPTTGAGVYGLKTANVPMATGTYGGYGTTTTPTKTTTGLTTGDDMAAYQGWAAEMKRRYPDKPVMDYSRWQRLVKPNMGATYGQLAGGTYGTAKLPTGYQGATGYTAY